MAELDRTTVFQSLLLGAALLAGLAVITLVQQERRTDRATAVQEIPPLGGIGVAQQNPSAAAVRRATALSDSLHDRAESLALWLASTSDTTGLALRQDSLSQAVDWAITELEPVSGYVSDSEFELLISLFLDYLEAPALAEEPTSTRASSTEAYLNALSLARAEVESSLMRYLGSF